MASSRSRYRGRPINWRIAPTTFLTFDSNFCRSASAVKKGLVASRKYPSMSCRNDNLGRTVGCLGCDVHGLGFGDDAGKSKRVRIAHSGDGDLAPGKPIAVTFQPER